MARIKDKNAKMQFLEKIIRLVGIQLNTIVEARPAKIVAGLDAHLTNNFLQLLAVCAQNSPNSSSGVRSVLEQIGVAEGSDLPAAAVSASRASTQMEDKTHHQHAEPKQHSHSQKRSVNLSCINMYTFVNNNINNIVLYNMNCIFKKSA